MRPDREAEVRTFMCYPVLSVFGSFLHPVPALDDEKPKIFFIIPLSEKGENISDICMD